MPDETPKLYRDEALEHYRLNQADGHVVRIAPTWTGLSYWLIVWVVAAGFVFSLLVSVNEYATGAAVVRIDGRIDLTAPTQCTVSDVLVKPGQRVSAGETLVRFYLAQEEAELARVQLEYDGLLLRLLREPGDQLARAGLNGLQAQRALAMARVAARSVVAPSDGIATDISVRAGQAVNVGDALITLATSSSKGKVVAMVPAYFRPMIARGLPLRLELSGFRFAYQTLRVESVGDEAVGPAEVKRFLGPESADTVGVDGPVVLVLAELQGGAFESAGQTYRYYDGMVGVADVKVRTQSLLMTMIPGLKDLLRLPND